MKARKLAPGQCRSGDGCGRPAVDGGRFCEPHRYELARIARGLDGADKGNARRFKK